MNIKVAVLDDHEFICRAISALGRDYPELAVVYTSTYPEEFQAWCLENHPDVAMVDLMLHGQLAGHETIRVLSQAGISCLAFTADHRRVPISMAMRAGARGLALKDESPDKHFETLREIHETGWSPSSAMAAALIEDADELARLAKAVMGDGAQVEAEVLIWSGVHGLASLLLDGPLAGEFSSTEDRIDFARGVVGLAGVPEVVRG